MDSGILFNLFYIFTVASASCPDNSEFFKVQGLCLNLFESAKTYDGADTSCRDEGGILARIKDAAIQQFVEEKYNGKFFWIGLEDEDNDGVYKWADQSSITYHNWGTERTPGKCGLLNKTSFWVAETCSRTIYYLCELPKVHDPARGIFYHRLSPSTDLTDSTAFKSLSAHNYVMCVQLCRLYHELCYKITFNLTQLGTDRCVLYARTYGSTISVDSSVLIYSLL